jgi:hypothetical protein
MAGSASSGLALLYLTKRYSLRTLLLAMAVIALCGALPWVLAPSGRTCRIAFVLPAAPTTEQVRSLRDRLAPRHALGTWPEPMRKALGVHPTENKAEIAFAEIGGRRVLLCLLRLAPHLNDRARRTIAEFYYDHGTTCVQVEVGGPGAPFGKPGNLGIGGAWDDWLDAWNARQRQRIRSP